MNAAGVHCSLLFQGRLYVKRKRKMRERKEEK